MLRPEEIRQEKLELELSRITIEKELSAEIEKVLKRIGMYYRIFARVKSARSLYEKLIQKDEEYKEKNKRLQDVIGIRIVLYYVDDIIICQKVIDSIFHVRMEDSAIDKPKMDEFSPVRLNLICDIPDIEEKDYIDRMFSVLLRDYRIDKTFEIQIRTVFSEGWQEIDHDIRYKHKNEWKMPGYYEFNRRLNGINATLEICDHTIVSVLDSVAYQCYKKGSIDEMFRYKLRIRLEDNDPMKDDLRKCFEGDKELLKKFYRLERGA